LPPARYVTILGQITSQALQICELEVYAKGICIDVQCAHRVN
jgi:hypothetical protein